LCISPIDFFPSPPNKKVQKKKMSSWVSVKTKKKPHRRGPAKGNVNQQKVRLVWIPDTLWKTFDEIDKEIYSVFEAQYPRLLTPPEILSLLVPLDPENNGDYSTQDVVDSLEMCLKEHIVTNEEKSAFQLKRAVE
jgi:hypothetical protein